MCGNFCGLLRKGKNGGEEGGPPVSGRGAAWGTGSDSKVLLVNDTKFILHLRDKIGSAYGEVRYKVLPQHSKVVKLLPNTFYSMLVYAEEKQEDGQDEAPGRVKTCIDTMLTVDTDQFADNIEIKITYINGVFGIRRTSRS